MKSLKFDFLAFVVGGMLFGVGLSLLWDGLPAWPNFLGAIYLFLCWLAFSFITDDLYEKIPKNALAEKIAFPSLFLFSPLVFLLKMKK
ncbi:TPA: hypothetical protein ACHWCH_000523 [Streptococcus suis]